MYDFHYTITCHISYKMKCIVYFFTLRMDGWLSKGVRRSALPSHSCFVRRWADRSEHWLRRHRHLLQSTSTHKWEQDWGKLSSLGFTAAGICCPLSSAAPCWHASAVQVHCGIRETSSDFQWSLKSVIKMNPMIYRKMLQFISVSLGCDPPDPAKIAAPWSIDWQYQPSTKDLVCET